VPKVTINDRTVEVAAGTNLVDAAIQAGVQIPHYCYHPRLSVVGQCRMCLVKIDGMPKLQAGCSTQVMKDGMVVRTDVPEVEEAQKGMMEFFLLNHPLDCPICDQAGECGLQDYSFKHGVAYSRFQYEDKRTYPGRERIPLGANVLLNMNRCIQCTRCVRFTHEVAGTSELGFFNRGARAEIGTFPGKELDNPLATCVVDICPVGALTSTRFRFAERVWYLDKKPSVCTGCEVGCNITMEHRRGDIKRYKPRYNVEVNDYWMCDYGRASFERYKTTPRLTNPRLRSAGSNGHPPAAASWKDTLDAVHRAMTATKGDSSGNNEVAFLGSGFLSCEEAYLLGKIADAVGSPHRSVPVDLGPEWTIPRFERPPITGREAAPNRRGAELAGLATGEGKALTADDLLLGDGAARCAVLVVADSDFGRAAHSPETVAKLRQAKFLVVFGWADSLLAQAADVVLPVAHHGERDGTFVNVEWRVQRVQRAFPAPAQVRPALEVLGDLLGRFDAEWKTLSTGAVFDRLAGKLPAFAGLHWHDLPATGATLAVAGAPHRLSDQAAAAASEASS
jgi:NADH-quinone oxidoreductase subunit G